MKRKLGELSDNQMSQNNKDLLQTFVEYMESAQCDYSDIAKIIIKKIPKSFHHRILEELVKLRARKENVDV